MAILLNDAAGFPSSSRHSMDTTVCYTFPNMELPNGTAHNVIVLKISSDKLCMAVSLNNTSTLCPDIPIPHDVSSGDDKYLIEPLNIEASRPRPLHVPAAMPAHHLTFCIEVELGPHRSLLPRWIILTSVYPNVNPRTLA